jgi:hypothetical protein
MGTLLQDEMATAIGAVDFTFLAQGQENAGMAQSTIATVTRNPRAFDFNYLNRLHDDAMSFNKSAQFAADPPPRPYRPAGPLTAPTVSAIKTGGLTGIWTDDTCLHDR